MDQIYNFLKQQAIFEAQEYPGVTADDKSGQEIKRNQFLSSKQKIVFEWVCCQESVKGVNFTIYDAYYCYQTRPVDSKI